MSSIRTRWAAIGAATAVTLGGGGIGLVAATSPADAVTYVPITPCRVMDTRPAPDNVGPKSSPLGPGETHTATAVGDTGDCTAIPADATAVALNVTAIGATLPTFLSIWAADAPQPETSSLNPVPGAPPTPNAVTTELNADGEFSVYNLQGSVDVLADVSGYYIDHDHDDRYYTKSESDGRFVESPSSRVQVKLFDFHPETATAWLVSGGWSHVGAVRSCLYAPIDAPSGASVASVDVTYEADEATEAQVSVYGLRTTPGPQPGYIELNLNRQRVFPATAAGQFEQITVVHDAGAAVPIGGDDRDSMIQVCPDGPIIIYGVGVNFD